MCDCDPSALKLCPLIAQILKLLEEAAKGRRFLPYSEAVAALSRFRIGRRLALLLIAYFHKCGLLVTVCGHGIKLIPEAEAREQERPGHELGNQGRGHQGSEEVMK